MDITNMIAAVSVNMSAARFQSECGVAVMKKAMDTQTDTASEIIEMLSQPQAVAPPSTALLDIRA